MDEECRSGDCRYEYLSIVCAPAVKSRDPGMGCFASKDCKSNACLGSSQLALALSPGKCGVNMLVVGSECTYNTQCSTALCLSSKCAANGTAVPGAACSTHGECSSDYCIGTWDLVNGGKCDEKAMKNKASGADCYQDDACSAGKCESVVFQEKGKCGAPDFSVALNKPCMLDRNCKSKFCIKGYMTSVTGQVCGSTRQSLQNGTSCKVDEECAVGHLCNGKYLSTGTCLSINALVNSSCNKCGENGVAFNKKISLPAGMLLKENEVVVRKFVKEWKKNVGS